MTDFLETKKQEIDARVKELRPAYDEYLKLEKVREVLIRFEEKPRPRKRRGKGKS